MLGYQGLHISSFWSLQLCFQLLYLLFLSFFKRKKKDSAASHAVTLDLSIASIQYLFPYICASHLISNLSEVPLHLRLFQCELLWLCKWSAATESVFQWQLQSSCASCESRQLEFVTSLFERHDLSPAGRPTHTWWVTQCLWGTNGNRLSF